MRSWTAPRCLTPYTAALLRSMAMRPASISTATTRAQCSANWGHAKGAGHPFSGEEQGCACQAGCCSSCLHACVRLGSRLDQVATTPGKAPSASPGSHCPRRPQTDHTPHSRAPAPQLQQRAGNAAARWVTARFAISSHPATAQQCRRIPAAHQQPGLCPPLPTCALRMVLGNDLWSHAVPALVVNLDALVKPVGGAEPTLSGMVRGQE